MTQLPDLTHGSPRARGMHPPRPSILGALAAFALVLVAGLVGRAVWASGQAGEAMAGGTGGDSIGSLPLTAPGGVTAEGGLSPSIVGLLRPSFALVGSEADLISVLLDATAHGPEAGYCAFALPDGRVRLEFYGRLTLLLAQERLMTKPVTAHVRVGSSFLGGVATLSVGGEPRGAQVLPIGFLPLPLQQLSSSGVLPLGMEWSATAPGGLRRVLDVRQVGALIRVDQRD
jgi:hypothetical protein